MTKFEVSKTSFSFEKFHRFQDDSGSVSGHQLPMVNVASARNNVLNRVTNQQDKWKRQVNSKTKSYDTFSMVEMKKGNVEGKFN